MAVKPKAKSPNRVVKCDTTGCVVKFDLDGKASGGEPSQAARVEFTFSEFGGGLSSWFKGHCTHYQRIAVTAAAMKAAAEQGLDIWYMGVTADHNVGSAGAWNVLWCGVQRGQGPDDAMEKALLDGFELEFENHFFQEVLRYLANASSSN